MIILLRDCQLSVQYIFCKNNNYFLFILGCTRQKRVQDVIYGRMVIVKSAKIPRGGGGLVNPLQLRLLFTPSSLKNVWPMNSVFLKGCVARNCDDCHPHNPASCTNCTQGFYSLQKKIMGNVRCVRHCPVGFTPIMRNDGTKLCKDSQSSKQYIFNFSYLNFYLFKFALF